MLTVSIGPVSLPLERLLLLVCLAVALIVSGLVARKSKFSTNKSSTDGLIATIFMVSAVVARISFVIQYFEQYRQDWLGMLDIRDGGFDGTAGIISAAILLIWYCWRRPKTRQSLLSGVAAGCGLWLLVSLSLWAIKDTSQQLPKLVVKKLSGQQIALSQVDSNKPRVINLWATWCPPCRREMPVLEQAQQENPKIGVVFVNQGEHPAVVEQFLNNQSLHLDNVVLDSRGMLGNLVGSRALPTTLFVDAKGRLVDAHLGELSRATLTAKLHKIMPEKTNLKETSLEKNILEKSSVKKDKNP